ncbi:MAG TPA: hypothetical protein VJL82_07165 [Rhizomicrobium sp.]|nr:hypothetical protein [Rhizomicrobium sp.]
MEAASNPPCIRLKNVGIAEIVPYIAFDYERFSLSSLESYLFCTEGGRNRAIAWPLLKLYYAAFFGAHSIMRATGCGLLRVDGSNARIVQEIAKAYSVTVDVNAGTYEFRLVQLADKSIDLELARVEEKGGAHEAFWKVFYLFLTRLASEVANNNEVDAQQTIAELAQVQALMGARGLTAGTWLSYVRNQINYRHEHDVWFPYGCTAAAKSLIARIPISDASKLRMDVDAGQKTVEAFTTCCASIAIISSELGKAVGQRSGTARFQRLTERLSQEAS